MLLLFITTTSIDITSFPGGLTGDAYRLSRDYSFVVFYIWFIWMAKSRSKPSRI